MSRLALGLLFTLLASPAAAQGKAEVTSFAGKTLDGKRITLADQRGKAVVISFWATWCVPCKKALPVLDKLETIAPVLAAEGDDDPFDTVLDKRVKPTQIITVEGVTIKLSHYRDFADDSKNPPNVVVYGHTHQSKLEERNGTIRINPGSPTFPGYAHVLGTVGLISIDSGKAEARIVQLEGDIGGFPNSTNDRFV